MSWISVQERLPEPGIIVLWYYETGETVLYARSEDEKIVGEHEPAITHWIALPDPPSFASRLPTKSSYDFESPATQCFSVKTSNKEE